MNEGHARKLQGTAVAGILRTGSDSAGTKAGGAGASASLTFPTRQLRGRLQQSTSPGDRGGGGSDRLQSRRAHGEDGAPSAGRTEFLAVPPGACLGTHRSHLQPGGLFPSPACFHTAERQKPLVESSASPRPVAVNMPTYHRQNILLQYYKHYVHDSRHAFRVTY